MKFFLQRHVHHSVGFQKEKTIATSNIIVRGPKDSFPDIWIQFTLGQPERGRGRTHSLGAKKSWGDLSLMCVWVCVHMHLCVGIYFRTYQNQEKDFY